MNALFLGVTLKIVDEIIDKDIEVQPLYLELFKCLTIMFLVLSTYNDFPFAISTLISLGFSYLAGGIDDDYWKAFIMTTMALCFKSYTPLTLWLIPGIFIMPIIIYGEALIFPENSSFEKMMGSVAMIPLLILFYFSPFIEFFKNRISGTGIVEKGILFGIGYFLTRTLVKAYILIKSSPTTSLTSEKADTENVSKSYLAPSGQFPQDAAHTHESESSTHPLTHEESQSTIEK
jgi:hypothetical protein